MDRRDDGRGRRRSLSSRGPGALDATYPRPADRLRGAWSGVMSGATRLFPLPGAMRRDPAVEAWMQAHPGELGTIARHWFEVMRECGDDVRELLHDGHPTACAGDAAFGYV